MLFKLFITLYVKNNGDEFKLITFYSYTIGPSYKLSFIYRYRTQVLRIETQDNFFKMCNSDIHWFRECRVLRLGVESVEWAECRECGAAGVEREEGGGPYANEPRGGASAKKRPARRPATPREPRTCLTEIL